MSQIETSQKLADSFADLRHCGDSHGYQTKSKTKDFLTYLFLIHLSMAHNLLNITV